MDQYVACVLNSLGRVVTEADVPSEPGALISFIRARAPHASRIGLESGPTSTWLWHALKAAGLPVICMDARHAHAALSVRPIKSDRNDARGLAEMVRVGWFKEVQIKSLGAHERMALLGVRRRLVDIRVEIDGQIRGILKTFGLVVGSGDKEPSPNVHGCSPKTIQSCRRSSRNCSTFGRLPRPRWRCLTRKSAVSSAMIQPCDAS